MTETEWLEATDPQPMLYFLRDKASARRFLLFGSGCCRIADHLFTDNTCRAAVDAADRLADGQPPDEKRNETIQAVSDADSGRRSARSWVRDADILDHCVDRGRTFAGAGWSIWSWRRSEWAVRMKNPASSLTQLPA